MTPEEGYSQILEGYRRERRYRTIPDYPTGERVFDLGSNDYLGLAKEENSLTSEFLDTHPRMQFTSSASRLLSSRQSDYRALEARLSELYGKEALLFNSGYHANTGVVSALAIPPGSLFLCDKLVHASIIDGLAIGKAEYKRWRHNDLRSLKQMLNRHIDEYQRIIIVVESVYSMDGDMAPISELIELKRLYPNVMLYVDEAHAFGVFGPCGLGVCEQLGVIADIDIIIGTFGKAAASSGAFAVTGKVLHNFLVNCARSFIFSTALPPVCCEWTLFLLNKIVGMTARREALARISQTFREAVEQITGLPNPSASQIVPLQIGDNVKAVNMSAALIERGIIAPAIRRPTVPPGGERIRFSLSADLSETDLQHIISTIKSVYNEV